MRLTDVDVVRRQTSIELLPDRVDFIVYIYNEYLFQEICFQSIDDLLSCLNDEDVNDVASARSKHYWIDVINRNSSGLPDSIRILCEYFNIHPLIMEDIMTIVPYMKLNVFHDTGTLYLLMKMLTYTDHYIQQQQISFYMNIKKSLLITFLEKSSDDDELQFQTIRNRLRRYQSTDTNEEYSHSRLRLLNVDYLFYCLVDNIIDRYTDLLEAVAARTDILDEILMNDEQSRTLNTVHSIYILKHDLLHMRILFNPLREIINRLQRVISDEDIPPYSREGPSLRLGFRHRIVRRKSKTVQQIPITIITRTRSNSIYLNEYMHIYFNDLNNRVCQVMDALEIQRERVAVLISFWNTLTSNQTQATLKFLMMISVLCMPCSFLTAINSLNFRHQIQLDYKYGSFVVWCILGLMISWMMLWYKLKRWI